MFFYKYLFLFIFCATQLHGLRIFCVLPCYGGHFGTMSSLIAALADTHEVTVLQTSPACQKKMAPFRARSQFKVIEEDLTGEDVHFTNFFQGIKVIMEVMPKRVVTISEYLVEYLKQNQQNFDIMIADSSQDGTLLAGEIVNIPTAVVITFYPGGVEHVVDKFQLSMIEVILVKLLTQSYRNYFRTLRKNHNLPELDDHGDFSPHEYVSRFPSLVATSPMFFPDHHPSIPFIFLGGPRNAEDYGPINETLSNWLSEEDTAVIYLSLGTVFTLSDNQILDYVGKVRSQGNYRLIWSLGEEMQTLVANLNFSTDKKLFFSDYLPQYTLLGHEKVTVFVTHGGLGSSIDLVKRRKPSVCAPQIFDQFFNCQKLTSLNVSELVSGFSFEKIDDAIRKIHSNYEEYVANADRLAKDFEEHEKREKIDGFLTKVASLGEVQVVKKFEFEFCSERCSQAWLLTKALLTVVALLLIFLMYAICRCCWRRCKRTAPKMKEN